MNQAIFDILTLHQSPNLQFFQRKGLLRSARGHSGSSVSPICKHPCKRIPFLVKTIALFKFLGLSHSHLKIWRPLDHQTNSYDEIDIGRCSGKFIFRSRMITHWFNFERVLQSFFGMIRYSLLSFAQSWRSVDVSPPWTVHV